MFTGIIEELGILQTIEHSKNLTRLKIKADAVLEGTKVGDSIAVNGTCLTVTQLEATYFYADIMPETLRKTEFKNYQQRACVNLERALRMGDRLGGHVVSGHIDSSAELIRIVLLTDVSELTFILAEPHNGLIIPKGSIAIDGISLTIMAVTATTFTVGIIPHTLTHTTLGKLNKGDRVNIEFDMYGKYVQAQYHAKKNPLTEVELEEWGY